MAKHQLLQSVRLAILGRDRRNDEGPDQSVPHEEKAVEVKDESEDLVVRLRPLPSSVPGIVRLRRLLKLMLRGFGLKCVSVSGVSRETPVSTEEQE
jgi:hypothetical protein